MSKRRFYLECIKVAFSSWLGITSSALIVAGVVTYFTPLLEGGMSFLVWAIPLAVFLATLILAPYSIYKGKEKEANGLQTKLDDMTSATPNLELYGKPYIDTRPIYSVYEIEGHYSILGKPFFAHAKFRNNPKARTTEATAQNVIAEISFFDKEHKPILGPIYGRWEGTPQPSTLSPFESRRHLAQVNLESSGYPRELDIAMKYLEDKDCYAFNNDSYHMYNWEIAHFVLKGDSFRVQVKLTGDNVIEDKEYWFMLYNKGQGNSIELKTMTPPTPDKTGCQP